MKILVPVKAKKKRELLDTLLDELGEECQRTLALLQRLRGMRNGKIGRGDILAELSAAILHLHVHTKELNKLIDAEFDLKEDD